MCVENARRESVSVCMATYNGERFILPQIQSILCQLEGDDELVISDDSSTDSTLDIINSIGNPRIRLLPHQRFRNHVLNFQNAVLNARHDIIFLCDQDDIWEPGKVDAVVAVLDKYDLVNTDHSLIDEDGNILMASYFAVVDSRPGLIKNFIKCSYFGCCMAFKRKILDVALPFPVAVRSHDIWLGHVADMYFKVKFLDHPYTRYRMHGNNTSSATSLVSPYSIWEKIGFRYQIVRATVKLLLRRMSWNM